MSEQSAQLIASLRLSYDDMPYPSLTYAQTHPDRLASMATLLGLDPAPVDRCRFLDIGCAVGGNLLPLAELLPESEFVGIDNAGKQIETGRGYVAELGLNNVHLEHMDVMDVPESLGKFDYIVAHGLYSWIPEEVRDELLAVIQRHLAPHGVAYVSYNTYPGWYMLRVIRDGLLLRARHLSDPNEQAKAAREIIEFLAETLSTDNAGPFAMMVHTYRKILDSKLESGVEAGYSLMLHDEMAEINDPVYFEQFVAHIERHELQYLSEVDLSAVMPTRIGPEKARELGELTRDAMEAEQWLDFIRFRTFRQTLMVHQEATIQKTMRPGVVGRFRLTSLADAEGDEVDLSPGVVEKFKASDDAVFATDHPLTKAAFLEMIDRRPVTIPFDELVRAAAARINLTVNAQAMPEINTLAGNALRALSYSPALIEFHVYQPPMSLEPGPRPRVARVLRWQAGNHMRATNLRHERVELDPFMRVVIQLADGRHDRKEMLDYFMQMYKEERFLLPDELLKTAEPEEIVEKQLQQALRSMARGAMLMAEE